MLNPTSSTTIPAPRHDGWTAERRARFLDSLAARGNVRLACRRVNLSPEAAGNPLPEVLERAIAQAAARPCESGLKSFPGTLSTASTSALAGSLASRTSRCASRHSPPATSRSPWA